MSEFDELLDDIRGWHARVFGKQCSPKRTAIKVLEEAAELHAAIRSGDRISTMNELFDVSLVVLNIAAELMRDEDPSGDFLDGIRCKMREVELRGDQIRRDHKRGIGR